MNVNPKTRAKLIQNLFILAFGLVLAIVSTMPLIADDVTRVQQIRSSPNTYINEVVTVEGFAAQYEDRGARTTEFYSLRDDYGAVITIRTTGSLPEVGSRYRVTGPVSTFGERGRTVLFISEEARVSVGGERPSAAPPIGSVRLATNAGDAQVFINNTLRGTTGADGTISIAGLSLGQHRLEIRKSGYRDWAHTFSIDADNPDRNFAIELQREATWVLLGGIAAVLLLMAGVLLYVARSRRNGNGVQYVAPPPPVPQAAEPVREPQPERVIEDRTVKMHAPPEGTLKILPGRFAVTGGLDSIQELRFYQPKGEVEAEITFGRASGPPYRHVQLKSPTVSSKQAKVVFDRGSKQYTLINYASENSNPTTVNGRTLGVSESVPLNDGDVIAMGEVEFRYAAS